MDMYLQFVAQAEGLSEMTFIKALIAIIFWVGGFAAAPMLFMATMGIFRNLAGMSSGFTKGMRGKMMARGQAGRERGFKAWKADKEAAREFTAQRRGAIMGAGSILTSRGRAARRAAGQQMTQQQAAAAAEDSSYTWKYDGDMNKALIDAYDEKTGKINYANLAGVSEENRARMRAMEDKYGTAALVQAAHAQAIAGKGYRADQEDRIWKDAARISMGRDGQVNEHVLASLVDRGRGAAMKAGYGSVGGASFKKTMDFAESKISETDYMDSVVDSTGADNLFHSSMNEESIRRVSARLAERAVSARRALDTAATPELKAAAEREYKQRLADVAGAYDTMSRLPGAKGDVAADTLMGVGLIDASGNSVGTLRDQVEAYRQDRDFLDRRREYGTREGADAAGAGAPPVDPQQGGQSPSGPLG